MGLFQELANLTHEASEPRGAVVDVEKVRDYLLSSTHPVGRLKAAFFMGLGYRAEDWGGLHKDLLDLALVDAATPGRFNAVWEQVRDPC